MTEQLPAVHRVSDGQLSMDRAVGYAPLVPSFSPYTADATSSISLAWRVTLLSLVVLILLSVGGPAAWHWYTGTAIEPRATEMMAIDGVVFLRRQGARDWTSASQTDQIYPGDTIRTAANARAFVRLFDQSTVQLYPSSTLKILRAEQGRFRQEKTTVVLELPQGRARFGVAPSPDGSASFFQLRTPEAEVHLEEGSYSADVNRSITQVRVRVGEATAHTAQGLANARAGQRLMSSLDAPPKGNLAARHDLVENGWFTVQEPGLPAGWVARDVSEQEPPGRISLGETTGAVTLRREGRGHGETVLSQQLDFDLWDYEKITLSANVRVLYQSLAGGGWQGTEYPLMLRVVYRDATGGNTIWYHGFYLHNHDGYPVRDAEQLPSTDWKRVEIDLLSLVPRPWRIQRVEIAATGWDYAAAISELHIWAE